MNPSDALRDRIIRELFPNLAHYRQHCISERSDADKVVEFIAALGAPVSVADVIEENDQAHLQEIADGAWGDGPKTRGAAIAALRSQVVA